MDCHHCITESAERKKGQHLRMEDRGAIKVLKKQGLGTRAIARQIGCAPSTVTNELRRGTPARKSNKGKAPGYSPKLGEAVYRANRASCHRHPKAVRSQTTFRYSGVIATPMKNDISNFDKAGSSSVSRYSLLIRVMDIFSFLRCLFCPNRLGAEGQFLR